MADSAYPRLAGALLPIFALRHANDFGIGDTEAVRDAISFCAEQKLGLLQVLPINETGDDNSPYNAISSVALDPVYLSLTPEQVPGLQEETLTRMVPESLRAELQHGPVQYGRVKQLKLEILSHAYVEFEAIDLETGTDIAYEFQAFVEDNMGWLPGYTLFRTLLNEYSNNALWHEWIPEHQTLADAETWLTTAADREELIRYRQFTAYVQWIAWRQWAEVRAWADEKQVRLVGDIPFGVSRYSADVWAEHELFDLTWSGGAPAEPFFTGGEFLHRWGQNWGIPLYDWPMHRAQNYSWWRQRITATGLIFHGFRIDHVLGFFRIYSFPWMPQQDEEYAHLNREEAKLKAGGREPHFIPRPDETEEDAALNCAEGEALLRMIQEAAGPTAVIAEDLGVVPKYVPPLLEKLGIPGFAIPQFIVDPETREYVPKDEMSELSIATWGTHDHPPLVTWYQELTRRWRGPDGHQAWLDLQRLMRFLGENETEPPVFLTDKLHEAFIRSLLESKSCWAIFIISDIFGVDWQFNKPGTATDGNWTQRLDRPLAEYLKDPAIGPKLRFLREQIAKARRAP
ncbi:MAG TPA: 4-alpha-glucanotransferase [Candidatus Methylacidiphilales bacterium]|jgi:4-alpha-glucanotransferase|nr:4-alpha-glucanotransferase [Candidatus Methylacidiphilales bacterium]